MPLVPHLHSGQASTRVHYGGIHILAMIPRTLAPDVRDAEARRVDYTAGDHELARTAGFEYSALRKETSQGPPGQRALSHFVDPDHNAPLSGIRNLDDIVRVRSHSARE